METITITLNGVEVSGNSGMTVLDLARESGVEIPTLCHDPYLAPTGACRLCLVEEERSGALLASCVAPISPGMVINTRSPRVMERRKTIVELMLASHPDSCLVCDKGNRCQLRRIASEMGIGVLEFQRIPQSGVVEEVNPFIERDLSRCILCGRCIRACQELVVEGAIDYLGRGFGSQPATLGGLPLEESECTFCGTCVALCPTGAIMEKEKAYRGTTTSTVDSVCPFCGCGCNISLEVKDNRLVRVIPNTGTPRNHSTLCVRGSYGYDFVHSPDRLTRPLVKTDGDFQAVSWEQALEQVAGEFRRIKDSYGADSLAVLGSPRCTSEENYLLQRLARGVLGTNNIDNGSRLYSAATRAGLGETIGSPGTTGTLDELEQSRAIVVIGANPTVSAPAVGYVIKRAVKHSGAKLLVIDPRQTDLVPFAHLWLRPGAGTDVALVNGLAQVIIKQGLFDEEYVTRKTDNFARLAGSLERYTPEYVEKITGVPEEDVRQAAVIFAEAESASIVYGNGITQYTEGTDGVMALANLAMLTGNIGRRGAGIFALQRENNARGACDMGCLPDFLPGYQPVDNARARESFSQRWGASLPATAGLTALEMIEGAKEGKIKGMLIMGENPVAGFPNPALVAAALASVEFLVVADMFLTGTAKLATVVLPAASFAEKEGVFTNFEGRVQRLRRAIEPVGESLPDWEIIRRIASRLGSPMPYDSPSQVREEIGEIVPPYQCLVYTELKAEDLEWADFERDLSGAGHPYQALFPGGFGRFAPVEYNLPAPADGDYPFTLIAGSVPYQFGSGTRSLRAWRLAGFSPAGWVEIGRVDAGRLGLGSGDKVRVISPAGEVTAPARVTDTLPEGVVFMPVSFPDSPASRLFSVVLDTRAVAPAVKACSVRLERTE